MNRMHLWKKDEKICLKEDKSRVTKKEINF